MDDERGPRTPTASRLVFGLWLACALGVILFLVLGVDLLRSPGPAPAPSPAPAAAPAPSPAGEGPYGAFEETLGAPIEKVAKQADYAILAGLLLAGYPPSRLDMTSAVVRTFHDEPYLFQELTLELDRDPERFTAALRDALAKWAPQAELAGEADGTWTVSVAGQATHHLFVTTVPAAPEAFAVPGAMLALVIDDMGQDMEVAGALADLDRPPTFSVLPGTPHSREVAALAASKGIELLLHLPLEPRGYPAVRPGPGALYTTMTPEAMRAVLAEDLAQVPGAVGVNNHMGSLFTQDAAGMDLVMGQLRARDMFFLDSLTTPESAARDSAARTGATLYRRDVFLDNVRDTAAIVRQLEKAERVALRHGQAVAIGHPYPETLAAIRLWQQSGTRVRLVHVSALRPAS